MMIGWLVSFELYKSTFGSFVVLPKKYCNAYKTLDFPQLFGPMIADNEGSAVAN